MLLHNCQICREYLHLTSEIEFIILFIEKWKPWHLNFSSGSCMLLGGAWDLWSLSCPLSCRCKIRCVPKKWKRSVLFWPWRSWSSWLMILMFTNPLVWKENHNHLVTSINYNAMLLLSKSSLQFENFSTFSGCPRLSTDIWWPPLISFAGRTWVVDTYLNMLLTRVQKAWFMGCLENINDIL